jgi:hypothetical protein
MSTKLMEFLPEFDSHRDSGRGCLVTVRHPKLAKLVGELGKHFEDLVNGSNNLFMGFKSVLQLKSVKNAVWGTATHQNCCSMNKQAKLFNELGIITGHEERNLLVSCLILFSNGGRRGKFLLLGRMKSVL